jgi:hypothetical protein
LHDPPRDAARPVSAAETFALTLQFLGGAADPSRPQGVEYSSEPGPVLVLRGQSR